jgi:hypothetical protein
LGASAGVDGSAAPLSAADRDFFEAKIRPVLVERCYRCHSHDADKVKGGLMLDTREGLRAGGDSGSAIEPGQPAASLLIEAIRYDSPDLKMPPLSQGGRLPDQQVADFTEWVRRGAPDPRTGVAAGSSPLYGGVGRQHWSFQPLRRQAPPPVSDPAWRENPIDAFVLAKLDAAGLKPNPPADRRTLIRRVTFDLTGLAPTEAEVQAFLADRSAGAYAAVVDRLLASPHYGERWARYWMDVARYSDTKGEPARRQTDDGRYPDAWTYRDYLIDAFNRDKPYNQFVLEQLAADRLMLAAWAEQKRAGGRPPDGRALAALGFLTLGSKFDGSVNDIINDQIDVTTKGFLGLTVTCARCHDHKFDPIPQKDYYSLYGVFANCREVTRESKLPVVEVAASATPDSLAAYTARLHELEGQQDACEAELLALRRLREPGRDGEKAEKRRAIQARELGIARAIADLASQPTAPGRAQILVDVTPARNYPVLVRGEAQNRGPVVPRRFLEMLSGAQRPEWKADSGRLELAEAIVDPRNPLTARVLVNRLWQQHFGVGFVATPDDLGNQSAPPTNPELLDFLAARFMADGWSIKTLQRLIVLSRVYQESSAWNPRYAERDPNNQLLWRYNLHRLDFEQIHDALLEIAGSLDLSHIGGRSIPFGSDQFARRRALYAVIDRRNPPELFTQFDFPNPGVPAGRRAVTTVPQQSLFLMNSPLVIEAARHLTQRPEFSELTSDEARVAALFEAVFQRRPTPRETRICLRYVESAPVPGVGFAVAAPAAGNGGLGGGAARAPGAGLAPGTAPGPRPGLGAGAAPAARLRSRAPLDAWTKLAHALFQTTEAITVE